MTAIPTSAFSLPKHLASGLWKKAQTGSTVSVLSGAEPMLFGETQYMTFTTSPKAEFVAEGASKSPTDVAHSTKTVVPRKAQVTMRYNEEVQWADEDYQLGVLANLADEGALALARALDLGVYHAINPLTGAALSGSPVKILDTTNVVEVTGASEADIDLEQAAGLVIADGFRPNGIAFDPSYSWTVATARYADGRKKYPELGFGLDVTSFEGLRASSSTTVSAPEATISGGAYESTNPNVKAIVGDWSALKWGVQRRIPVELIKFGDPDGLGDLKRKNQIALRLEVVYGWVVMDLGAFSVVKDAEAES